MTKSPFIVYILPIILSVTLGAFVMAEALNDPERELDMWQFDASSSSTQQHMQLSVIGLDKTYSTSESIEFKINVNDVNFDCGDLYITIYQTNQQNVVITQSGYLKQCFIQQNQNIPLGDIYSESITKPGKYQIHIEIFDQKYRDSLSYVADITVK